MERTGATCQDIGEAEADALAAELEYAEAMRQAELGDRRRTCDWPTLRRVIVARGGIADNRNGRTYSPYDKADLAGDLFRVHGRPPDVLAADLAAEGWAQGRWSDGDEMLAVLRALYAEHRAIETAGRPQITNSQPLPATAPAPVAAAPAIVNSEPLPEPEPATTTAPAPVVAAPAIVASGPKPAAPAPSRAMPPLVVAPPPAAARVWRRVLMSAGLAVAYAAALGAGAALVALMTGSLPRPPDAALALPLLPPAVVAGAFAVSLGRAQRAGSNRPARTTP